MAHKVLGIDVGGTFTDFVLIDLEKQDMHVWKILTTPQDPTLAIVGGVTTGSPEGFAGLRSVKRVVHGTTLVTNTIIERKGAKVGLIMTQGHRDVLEIGNEIRYDLHDLFLERPEPVVPRSLRSEVKERLSNVGEVLLALDEASVEEAIHVLRNGGAEIVAVCLLNSYIDSAHEERVESIAKTVAPDLPLVLSSKTSPEIREYERVCTTTLNAYVRPRVEKYLRKLSLQAKELGLEGEVYIMLSSGGFTTLDSAAEFPIRLIESGPAAGALAAAYYCGLPGSDGNAIAFDMGGTTAKICVVEDGRARVSTTFETDRVYRFKRGSGLPVKTPVIDMIEIGAGGGSIAHVDRMGLLKVGPDSAGANPGPACYGLGGTKPTVTDANLILGYLDPEFFLGGSMRLDAAAARRAFEAGPAGQLGKSATETAIGVFEVVCENMAGAAKVHLAERGSDPRRSALIAFGGAGPIHASRVARLLGIRRVICPIGAGTFSAFGMLVAPMAFDLVRTYVSRLDEVDLGVARKLVRDMEREGQALLALGNVADDEMETRVVVDMRYLGQGHEVSVAIDKAVLDGVGSLEALRSKFSVEYQKQFGRLLTGSIVEAISWRVTVSGRRPAFNLADLVRGGSGPTRRARDAVPGPSRKREAYYHEVRNFLEAEIYERGALSSGASVEGPAIIEEVNSTIIVPPKALAQVDENLSVIIDMDA